MSKHPAERDLRTYRIATTMCAVGLIIALFGMGLALKLERKAAFPKPMGKTITYTCSHNQWEAGECAPETTTCYIMSDNVKVCP